MNVYFSEKSRESCSCTAWVTVKRIVPSRRPLRVMSSFPADFRHDWVRLKRFSPGGHAAAAAAHPELAAARGACIDTFSSLVSEEPWAAGAAETNVPTVAAHAATVRIFLNAVRIFPTSANHRPAIRPR